MTEEIKMTREGNKVVFKCGTKHLTEVPVDVVEAAIRFTTKWATETMSEVNVVLTVDGDYEADIHKWHENPVCVCLRVYNGDSLLVRFEEEEVFNLLGVPL